MISDKSIAAAADKLCAVFRDMIEEGAGAYEIQRAILAALWKIGRDSTAGYAAGAIASDVATRIQGVIAALKGKAP
jgi:hypothetical protein